MRFDSQETGLVGVKSHLLPPNMPVVAYHLKSGNKSWAVRVACRETPGIRIGLGSYDTKTQAMDVESAYTTHGIIPPKFRVRFRNVFQYGDGWYAKCKSGGTFGPFDTVFGAAYARRRICDNAAQQKRRHQESRSGMMKLAAWDDQVLIDNFFFVTDQY